MAKHTSRPQNSTITGHTTLAGAILYVFTGEEVKDALDAITSMKWDQLMPLLIMAAGSISSIIMEERTKDDNT